ncbi:uroporphyrinogen decarboxylase family protein [uncultured Robinsoniella sp.]|uniref:uroporphyrinogen decarboxylase family protein n=1 Tax=uncultured Robinsoniella sp. TaxID=904190 RepID=UPI00374F2703
MNSRERIIAALNHRKLDVIPIDFGAMRSTGISIWAYQKLKEHLGLDTSTTKLYDVFQQLAEPEKEILDRLGADVVQVHRLAAAFGVKIDRWKAGDNGRGIKCMVPEDYHPIPMENGELTIQRDGKVLAIMPREGYYFDQTCHPLAEAEDAGDLESFTFPVITEEEICYMEQQAKDAYENTDRAVLMEFGGNILEAGESDFGFENFFMNLLAEPELVHAYLNRLSDSYIESLKRLMPRVHQYIQIIQFGDDLGSQESTLISKEVYREMIKPYHKKIFYYIRENYPEVKVFLHSCGAILELIPDLIDAGVQILNPIQIAAKGMDPEALVERFGDDLVFWGGGSNTQVTCNYGTVEEIQAEVKKLIQIFSKKNGYVFNQVHNLQANVPPEKILAIYDAAQEYRKEQIQSGKY